jgi:hypothetical protein
MSIALERAFEGLNNLHEIWYYVMPPEAISTENKYKLSKIWGVHGGDYEEWRLLGVTPCGSCKDRRFGGS